MEKTPRYTQRERNMVLTYAAQHKDVIENKRTDAESNRKKDEVWLQIAKDFNGKVYHQRSAKQLRQLYKNMKLLLKKDLCGEDKGNRSFLDLLNTLSQQESVAQYIAEQMSPDGAGSQATGNGRHLADDYEDSKLPLYEGMDTDVILIKSETISDNEQTENGMDCMDDDDDDDCPSPKAPEVCLEEEDGVLFPTDRSHLQQHSGGGSIASNQVNGNGNNGIGGSNIDALPRAPSSPVCSTKTSISSTGSYMSAGQTPKAEITLTSMGNIRVGAFASINNTLHNGNSNSNSSSHNNNNNNNNNNNINSSSNKNNNNSNNGNNVVAAAGGGNSLQLTAEQMQQHLLLNGLGLSAVQHPPAGQSLQAAINAATSGVGSGRQTQTLQLPRLQRGHNAATSAAAATNGGNNNATGVQLLLNGHQTSRDKSQQQQQLHQQQLQQQQQQQLHPSGSITLAAGSFNGYNGLSVINCGPISSGSNNSHNNSASSSGSNNNNHNNSSGNLQTSSQNNHNNNHNNNISGSHNTSGGSNSGTRGQHNEYMMTLAVEERKLKIELLNAQIKYWETLTKKLDSQSGHYPNPACPCHFPGTGVIGGVPAAGSAAVAVAANALQTQSSSS